MNRLETRNLVFYKFEIQLKEILLVGKRKCEEESLSGRRSTSSIVMEDPHFRSRRHFNPDHDEHRRKRDNDASILHLIAFIEIHSDFLFEIDQFPFAYSSELRPSRTDRSVSTRH